MAPTVIHDIAASDVLLNKSSLPSANGTSKRTIQTPLPNPSLQVTKDHTLKMEEAPVYAPAKGEVLLHIKATGVCGSDIHFWKHGRIGSLVVEGDCILGHEAAGVVLQCGEGVSNLKIGINLLKRPHAKED